MATRFTRTVLTVEVLSEYPYEFAGLANVAHDITEGDCSGSVVISGQTELTPEAMAKALLSQGSDPGFFQLDDPQS